jgi:hypothetical protein
MEVLDFVKAHNESEASRHFKIPRTMLRSWKGMDSLPKEKSKQKKKGQHLKKGAGRPLSYSPALEEEIVQWVLESRDLHVPIPRKTIQTKALTIIGCSNPKLKASEGWLQKFMLHNSLVLHRHTSIQQKLPEALEQKLAAMMDKVKTLRERHNFADDLIINMDETPIFFDMQRAYTVHRKGSHEVSI